MAPLPDRDHPGRLAAPATAPEPGATGLLAALADLQRHLDVLGDDLAAADRALVGWRGHSRARFRHHLLADLARLADLLADLRHVRGGLHDPTGAAPHAPPRSVPR